MSALVHDPNPRLSETEEEALALYDRLQELHVQIGLLQAQQDHSDPQSPTSFTGHSQVDEARTQLLEAKAALELRDYVFESAIVVRPILRAVHGGTQASPVERDILPLIQQRDLVSTKAAQQASVSYEVRDRMLDLELERLRAGQQNATLASELLRLSKTTGTPDVQVDGDTKLERQPDKTKGELQVSRQRWKTIKGATSALVAGSGVDWVRDERLRGLVLDPPDLSTKCQ
ncbi:centromere protein H (CENP-H)-domain-containing protein [Pseudoneurospora amorphoporcata]|uniref:Centromere protein H (CENP-H)-domain-containing protein n=1 Tax=Pseudoneurospora amorphoporcata TaxID=241081 RepID=A0AAN6P3Y8_9PEZI|nr:centromere protein H (CENP-H)-domain-containing protein [Pseudoneurospora amorphoporcata]